MSRSQSRSSYSSLLAAASGGTPQNKPLASSSSTMAKNNAGGFVFTLDSFSRLERFLILGSDSNTYYQTAKKLTQENAKCVLECWQSDPYRTAILIHDISYSGRAPRNSPALFAIALGTTSENVETRSIAFALVKTVCRTASHLFELCELLQSLGKNIGSRMSKRAVAEWYNARSDDTLAYQLVKYRQRYGFTHERLIRLCHPHSPSQSSTRGLMYDWLRGREVDSVSLPAIIQDYLNAQKLGIISSKLPWEALPTEYLSLPGVWRGFLTEGMPLGALVRNLGKMTSIGVFDGDPAEQAYVQQYLTNEKHLKKSRIHPFNLLNALHTYRSGKGFRGSLVWHPNPTITGALESAFYKSFSTITPTNKRIMLALDVSGSMAGATIMNSALSAREAAAAMAMATLRSEESATIYGFTSLAASNYQMGPISKLAISPTWSLEQVVRYTSGLPFTGTDCSLPMLEAIATNLAIDAFVIYTDNETWHGNIHPMEALRKYREHSGIEDAKLVVVGLTSTGFSIADKNDPNCLDVVGFDASAPAIIADFIRGSGERASGQHQNNTSTTSEQLEQDDESDLD